MARDSGEQDTQRSDYIIDRREGGRKGGNGVRAVVVLQVPRREWNGI